MIAAGQVDSAEADVLRDRMETPEARLSRAEMVRLNGLSADLYMLQDDEIYERAEESQRTRETLGAALQAAWERREWERALELLRKGPLFLTRAQAAYLRFRVYASLGHLDTARLFLEYATRLDPDNVGYWGMLSDPEARGQLHESSPPAGSAAAW